MRVKNQPTNRNDSLAVVWVGCQEQWWLKQNGCQASDGSIQHGITAYSQKQAYYCKCLAESFAMAWLPLFNRRT